MDSDGFAVQGRRRRGTTQRSGRDRDRETFNREVPKYSGTAEDFDRAHAQRYGREEGLGPDGKHHHGSYQFPHGSDRQKLHSRYSASTKARDGARSAYERGLATATQEYNMMEEEEQEYYTANTGGLAPHQHERLDPHAKQYRDKTLNNAKGREDYLRSHPHGYHSMNEQIRHHDYASNAYGEYEYARDQQAHHERYRSYSNVDTRRDKYGRPVSHR